MEVMEGAGRRVRELAAAAARKDRSSFAAAGAGAFRPSRQTIHTPAFPFCHDEIADGSVLRERAGAGATSLFALRVALLFRQRRSWRSLPRRVIRQSGPA